MRYYPNMSEDHVNDTSMYTWFLASPPVWIQRADELLHAASCLEDEVRETLASWCAAAARDEWDSDTSGVPGIYFMLAAFAIENLLKAKLIRLHRGRIIDEVPRNAILPRFLKSHDLYNLAVRAGFSVDSEDEKLLRRLARAGVWDGRYPAPAHARDLTALVTLSDGVDYFVLGFREDDVERIGDLIQRIRKNLELSSPHARD